MLNPDTDLLFPPRIIASLRGLQGAEWAKLVDRVAASPETSREKAAFVLMMARLNGCAHCDSHSFRAAHGCTHCAQQSIKKFEGSEINLLALFENTQREKQLQSHI